MRWPGNLREVCASGAGVEVGKRILAREDLERVLAAVSEPLAAAPGAVERKISPA